MTARRSSILAVVVLWIVLHPGGLEAQSLVPGTFELGQESPTGWHRRAAGSWAKGTARRGMRHLRGQSLQGEVAWESQVVGVQPATDYRLEGWIRCPAGEAHLSLEFVDEKGHVVRRGVTPTAKKVADWRYLAVECGPDSAVTARAQFWVKGEADLDDVALTPVATSYLGNKSVEADNRGRVG